jgi:hypothetical protein
VGWYVVQFTAMSFITRQFVGVDPIQLVGCSICDNGVVVKCGVIYVCVSYRERHIHACVLMLHFKTHDIVCER